MDTRGPSFATRLFRAFRNLVLFTLFVGLAGAAAYALSLVNSRTYTLETRAGQLVVLKGRMLPMGADPWLPADPSLADAYAPLDLEGNVVAVSGQKFGERDELDRALFTALELLAKPRISSDQSKELDKGLAYVRRADKLKGLSEEQQNSLKKMKSELAFYLAQQRLDDSRRQLEEALTQLKLAAESDSKHKAEANVMLLAVEPQVKLLATTLRATTTMSRGPGGANTGLDGLLKALEPQMKDVFQSLQSGATSGTAPSKEKPAATPVESETETRPSN